MRRLVTVAMLAGLLAALLAMPVSAAESSDTVGVVDSTTGEWFLRDPANGASTSFFYGDPGDYPLMGDWDCDGVDTPGLYRQSDGYVYLRNTNTQGVADIRFFFGNPSDIPLAGDFDGDGCDTVSIYRPSEGRVFVINRLGANEGGLGQAEVDYYFGNPGDKPFVGDFDDDGVDTVGLHRGLTGFVYIRNSHTPGVADEEFFYGDPGDVILAGNWDGAGGDTVGIWRPADASFYLRNTNTPGNADETVIYGNRTLTPILGQFGTLPGGDSPPPRGRSLPVVARQDWGARPPVTGALVAHTITRLTVHHAGDQSTTTGPSRYRAWQAWHMDGKGWPDISYHFIVGVDGTVYEGRKPAFETDTFTDYDTTGHLQVVVEGNFETDEPTLEQLDSLVAILTWAATAYDVSPATIAGHRGYAHTTCPGKHLAAYLDSGQIQSLVEQLLASQGVVLVPG